MNILKHIHPQPPKQRRDLKLQPHKGLSCRLSSMFGEGSHLFTPIQGSRQILTTLQKASFNDTLKQRNVNIPGANYWVQPEKGDQVPTLSA